MEKTPEVWHRVEDVVYAAMPDDLGERYGPGRLELQHLTFEVVKHTEKGVWIKYGFSDKRFVRKDAKRQYASPTLEAAKEKFTHRKNRQISILQTRLNRAREALDKLATLQ